MISDYCIEDLYRSAAGDGGSIPFDPRMPGIDFNELFKAWSIERGHSIECEMLLNLSMKAMASLLDDRQNRSLTERRKTRALIRQINHRLKAQLSERT